MSMSNTREDARGSSSDGAEPSRIWFAVTAPDGTPGRNFTVGYRQQVVESAGISVVVRVRDEAVSLGRCLALIRAQTVVGAGAQLIVVDNDSRDDSAEVARAHGALVVPISTSDFSFGGALNRGVAAATAEIVVALSAHAFPHDAEWLSQMLDAFSDPAVACVCGDRFTPDGSLLSNQFLYDASAAAVWPSWGYSNVAGGFRTELWRERPFREDLPACEDREWGRYWALKGRPTLLDPALVVNHDHTHDPVRDIYRRARRESAAFAAFLGADAPGPASLRELVRIWWSDTRFYRNRWRARASHRRAAQLLGVLAGRVSAVSA
jgi:glycosyltransferase involved in cell wall biosynthesis